jgi:undecaprenyl pyrophosphate synthase
LDGKQATIADGGLTIAKTSGLQTALDSKEPTITSATDLTINSLTTTNISTTNLSATEISTASATMGSNTLTMASDKYLESISNYAYYYKNSNSAMTGTTHLVEFNSNTLQSALVTKTSNSRYTINRAGYYLVTAIFTPKIVL